MTKNITWVVGNVVITMALAFGFFLFGMAGYNAMSSLTSSDESPVVEENTEVGRGLPYAEDLAEDVSVVTFEYPADAMPLEQAAAILQDNNDALVEQNMELRHKLVVREADNLRLRQTITDLEREGGDLRRELDDARIAASYVERDIDRVSMPAALSVSGYVRDGVVLQAEQELGRPLTDDERIIILQSAVKEAPYFTASEVSALMQPFSPGAGERLLSAAWDVRERAINAGLPLQPWD